MGATWRPSERGSLNKSEWLQPRYRHPTEKLLVGRDGCAEPLPRKVRPLSPRKKRASALGEHRGVGAQTPMHRLQS